MNEQERADWLARAIDNLIQRREPVELPEDLHDEDLQALIRVARIRLEAAQTISRAGLQYEGAVWQKVLERLDGRVSGTRRKSLPETQPSETPAGLDGEEFRELEDIARLRKRMADEVIAFAETQRDAVWQTLQSRLQSRRRKRGLFSFLRPRRGETEALPASFDAIAVGQTVWQASDSRTDELVDLARKRRTLAKMAQNASSNAEARVWSRIEPSVYGVRLRGTSARHAPESPSFAWRRIALAAGIAAVVVAAVGPIPATGLAHHPAVQMVGYLGDYVGVTESGAPPDQAPVADVVQGTHTSAADASGLLGIKLSQPAIVPSGYELTASTYYPEGITSSGGAFLLTYTSGDGVLMVFQEAAAGADLGVGAGSAQDVTLTDGTPATYVHGAWSPGDYGFTWASNGSQTLVFDRDGVRTVIQFLDADADLTQLIEVAESIS